jgi:TolB-like protein
MRTLKMLSLTFGLFMLSLAIQIRPAVSIQTPPGLADPDTTDSLRHNEQFDQAVAAYQQADFERAIGLFSSVAENPEENRVLRRDALHYLGRSFLAKREEARARVALTGMVELEPPRIELDPDIEPPKFMQLYYDVRKACDGNYLVDQESNLKTLAVLDFSNHSIDDHERLDPLQKGFSSLFINQLNGATELKVIERERIQWLLGELDLQQDPSRVDPQTAVQAGKLLGAHAVLMGSFIKQGKHMVLSARLVSVETSEILMTEQVSGKSDQFFELAEELSLSIARGINVELDKSELGARSETRSLDAMISYSEGLDLLEEDNFQAAYEKFLEALDFDPSYQRAQRKARSIEPFLRAS